MTTASIEDTVQTIAMLGNNLNLPTDKLIRQRILV